MKNFALNKVIQASVDPERAKHFFGLLAGAGGLRSFEKSSAKQLHLLAALFSGSQALGNLLVAHPDWIDGLEIERLRFPRREQGLRHEVESWLRGLIEAKDYGTALARVREFKQRE